MRSHHRSFVVAATLGLSLLAGCGAGVSSWTLEGPEGNRARVAPPLGERDAARLVRAFWEERGAAVPAPGEMREVNIVRGAFTRAGADEAVVAFRSGRLGHEAWQAWLLQSRGQAWQVARNLATSCSGRLAAATVERGGPAALVVHEACMRFGREEGRVRLLTVGATADLELFAAPELSQAADTDGPKSIRHAIELTDLDGDGVAEIVDTASVEHRTRSWGAEVDVPLSITAQKIYKRYGQQYLVVPADDERPLATRT